MHIGECITILLQLATRPEQARSEICMSEMGWAVLWGTRVDLLFQASGHKVGWGHSKPMFPLRALMEGTRTFSALLWKMKERLRHGMPALTQHFAAQASMASNNPSKLRTAPQQHSINMHVPDMPAKVGTDRLQWLDLHSAKRCVSACCVQEKGNDSGWFGPESSRAISWSHLGFRWCL